MKKRIIALICALSLAVAFTGCGRDSGEYSERISTSLSDCSVNFSVEEGLLKLSGRLADGVNNYLLVSFDGENAAEGAIALNDGGFDAALSIPDKGGEITVDVFGGPEEYGSFESIVIDFVRIKKVGKEWKLLRSPVRESNEELFKAEKDPRAFTGPTELIQSDNEAVKLMADEITRGIDSDYEKIRAIHDWIAENVYYDYDALASGSTDNVDAVSALENRRGVCQAYADLFAAMARSQGIPCRVQSGYALGISVADKEWTQANMNETRSNHAWNEAYVNGRWVIVDATWDSQNRYQDGRYSPGKFIRHVYFDANMEFFSLSHRLMAE